MDIQWPLVLFTALTGTGGGLCFASGLDGFMRKDAVALRKASIIALALLVLGGICSVFHLGTPLNAVNVLFHPAPGIFVELVLLALLCVALAATIVLGRANALTAPLKTALACGMVLAILLAFMAGASYVMPAHPAWNTPLLPASYALTAIAAGFALCSCLLQADRDIPSCSRRICAAAGATLSGAAFVVTAAWFAIAGAFGQEAALCWITLIVGCVAPTACLLLSLRQRAALAWCGASFVFAFGGAVLVRAVMWLLADAGIAAYSIALL